MKAWQGKIHSFKDGAVAFGIGALAGGLGAATGGAAFVAAGGGAAGAGGFLAGAAGGVAGSAISSPIQGLGNAAYFGDPYRAKDFGRDVLLGGLAGGVINGAIAGFSKTPGGVGRNVWNGDRVADGASKFSVKNSSLLKQQGWVKGETGGWSNAFGGDLTFQGVDGAGSLGGRNVGDVVGSNGVIGASFTSENISGFYVYGNSGMVNGNIFQRNIQALASIDDGANIMGLVRNFENQAMKMGAKGIEINGLSIENAKLMNSSIANRLGYSYQETSKNSIRLFKPLR